MKKLSKIDLGEERLLSIASGYVEEHNYIGALRMLNKNAELNGNAEYSYMLYAEIFDDMGLYDKCVDAWFRYIDYAGDGADFAEAYEGLAISFMNMGEDNFAAYYYNKLLIETSVELSEESRHEIISSFLAKEKPPLRFAYPPKLADFSEEIERGVCYMRENKYDDAIEEFSKVGEGNEKYNAARNYIAMCKIISDKCDEAEEECLAILQKTPDDVQAMTTLAAVKTQQNKSEEGRQLAERLVALDPKAPDDIYKVATVCCENGLHAQAYNMFSKLSEDYGYDLSVMYFKAISAFNSGQIAKSLQAFDELVTVYPEAIAAQYWYSVARKESKKTEEKRKKLDYFYRLPQKLREENLKDLTVFMRLNEKQVSEFMDIADISDCVRWCFDEGDVNNADELKTLGAMCAVRAGCEDLVRNILLLSNLSDSVKLDVINALSLLNDDSEYGVVICNIYRHVHFVPLEIGRAKRKYFLQAKAHVIARFAMIEDNYSYLINSAASKLYYSLSERGFPSGCKNIPALAAAILKKSDVYETGNDDAVCAMFGADKEVYLSLISEDKIQ